MSPVQEALSPHQSLGGRGWVDRLRRPHGRLEIIIPCRNEAGRLPSTLSRTLEYLESQPYTASVVVIDNGSTDRTSEAIRSHPRSTVQVRRLGCSAAGKGAAVRRGILTSGADWVGFMDADLATPIETLDRVVPLLENGEVAVCASRYAPGSGFAVRQPAHRRVGSSLFRFLASRVVPAVRDTQCGFKFFDGELIRSVAAQLRVDGFAFDLELLAALAAAGHTVREIPVVWSDVPGSSFSAGTHGVATVRDAARLAVGPARR